MECHDLEPFYPTEPYHTQEFRCFTGASPHEPNAICVAPVDLSAKSVAAAAHGRLPEFLKMEHEKRIAEAAFELKADEMAAPGPEQASRGNGVQQVRAVSGLAAFMAFVAVLGVLAAIRLRRSAADMAALL